MQTSKSSKKCQEENAAVNPARVRDQDRTDGQVVWLDDPASQGDPVCDYVALWMEMESFHQNRRLTEEGWAFLGDHLQRPIEMRLLERQPVTLNGALAALEMAAHLMESLDYDAPQNDAAWYRRLRLHLVKSARGVIRDQAGRFIAGTPPGNRGLSRLRGQEINRETTVMTIPKEDKQMTKTPWLIQLTAEDNALAPVVTRGATVSIDCSERDLVDGGIYAIKDGDRAALWLFHEGFAGMSLAAGGIAVGHDVQSGWRFPLHRPGGRAAGQDCRAAGRCAAGRSVGALECRAVHAGCCPG